MNQVVKLNSNDLSEFYQLYLYAFKNRDSVERKTFFDYRYAHAKAYGIVENGQIQSGMLSIPFKINFHGVAYQMNGICDVMSYPEFGGHGAITDLMQQSFQDMLQEHVELSYLAPFSYDFYRRFGYEEVFDRAIYSISNLDLPRIKLDETTGKVARLSLEKAVPFIREVYQNNAQTRNAGLQRESWWWHYLTLKHPDWLVGVYFENKIPAGYVIYEGQGDIFQVQEIMPTNQASYQHLMRFIFQHSSMYTEFRYANADPSGELDFLRDPSRMNIQLEPYMMARIVDLAAFVQKYPFKEKVHSIRIAVTDTMIPENNGIWRLRVNVHGTSFDKLSDNANNMADLRVSIQKLTQILMGYRSAEQLQRRGRISGNLDSINNLDRALQTEAPMLWDYF